MKPPRVLTVAGSDSGGGAGIEADVKTITALGGFAETCITALTAQNSLGVKAILPTPVWFIEAAFAAVVSDLGVDAIKTGMLPTAEAVEAVARAIKTLPKKIPVVVDPVLRAKGGHALADKAAAHAIKTRLVPLATLLTPNVPEAETLTGLKIRDRAGMEAAGRALLAMGAKAVLVKGGHLPGGTITDLLVAGKGVDVFTAKRIRTRHSHGTGCTLASAIALFLAHGLDAKKAVAKARGFVLKALAAAPGYGKGSGPMGHMFGRSLLSAKAVRRPV
ncbi:MAG TPA: bifunctional hydroxymethylpyrimidine kinase/phosphomethylpyrimidine kinase [Sphingomonadales bacterium]|nr:bifunctional hydroxymethylpyrimidine kinase/phosphomethylpyrimidine kinase [Sphingomonadales bacterium]